MKQVKSKTILFVGHSPELHGAEYSLLRLMTELKANWKILVLAPGGGPFEHEVNRLELPFFDYSPQYPFRLIHQNESSYAKALLSLKENLPLCLEALPHFDLVHSNTLYILEGAALAATRQVPHIWNLREVPGASPTWKPAMGWEGMLNFVDIMSDDIISVSHAVKNVCSEKLNQKHHVVHNGLAPRSICSQEDSRAWMVSMGCRPSAKIAVTIGNFIPEKGHLRLLDSLSVYLHQYPEWQCLWIGEHHFTYPDVVKRIQELGLQDRILCPGAVPKAGQNISGADLYLLPSLTEAFPTVLLEARLAGVPFLATDCGGAKEIAEAGGGWCAEYGSHFNEQLQSCFKGQLNAPVCNSSAFTMQSMATSYETIYAQAIEEQLQNDESRQQNSELRQQVLRTLLDVADDLKPLVELDQKIKRAKSWRGIGRWFRSYF